MQFRLLNAQKSGYSSKTLDLLAQGKHHLNNERYPLGSLLVQQLNTIHLLQRMTTSNRLLSTKLI